jgi:hypothetical protein
MSLSLSELRRNYFNYFLGTIWAVLAVLWILLSCRSGLNKRQITKRIHNGTAAQLLKHDTFLRKYSYVWNQRQIGPFFKEKFAKITEIVLSKDQIRIR